jgi:hypothetical protein
MRVPASIKHLQIHKANNMMFIVVGIATVLSVFSLLSAKALFGQSNYQRKVLSERHTAVDKLKTNVDEAKKLKQQYDAFESQNPNIIGGKGGLDIAIALSKGQDQSGTVTVNGQPLNLSTQDGDNAKIVLDALPSRYDFPALISSIEKIANLDHAPLQSVIGTDESNTGTQDGTTSNAASAQADSQTIPFSVTTQTDYNTAQTLVKDLERSIRPMDITRFSIHGNGGSMNETIEATTNYQQPVSLQIKEKEVP